MCFSKTKLLSVFVIGLFVGTAVIQTSATFNVKDPYLESEMSDCVGCAILYPNGGEEITGGCQIRWEISATYPQCYFLSQVSIGDESSDYIPSRSGHKYAHTISTMHIDDGSYKALVTLYRDYDCDGIPDCIACKDYSDGFFTVINGPYKPSQPSGPDNGRPGKQYNYSTSTSHSHGEDWDIEYMFSWGDGKYTDWLGPFPSGQKITADHIWDEKGNYSIKVKAKGPWNKETKWSDRLVVSITQKPPDKPVLNGPSKGRCGIEYIFNVTTNDPDGDPVSYFFDWYTETDTEWRGPYSSGEVCSASHVFSENGSYQIKVKANDSYGSESEWSDPLTITMPKNKLQNNPMERFIEYCKRLIPPLRNIFDI